MSLPQSSREPFFILLSNKQDHAQIIFLSPGLLFDPQKSRSMFYAVETFPNLGSQWWSLFCGESKGVLLHALQKIWSSKCMPWRQSRVAVNCSRLAGQWRAACQKGKAAKLLQSWLSIQAMARWWVPTSLAQKQQKLFRCHSSLLMGILEQAFARECEVVTLSSGHFIHTFIHIRCMASQQCVSTAVGLKA